MIVGAARLHDGAIAVGDNQSSEIRIFDSSGKHLRSFGRRGTGPGEFDFLWYLWRIGDTLVGFDRRGVGQAFSHDGQHIRTIPRPRSTTGERVQPVGVMTAGFLIAFAIDASEPPDGRSTTHATLVMVDSGSAISSLGRFPARERIRQGTGRPHTVIFGPAAHVAVFETRVCIGYSDRFAFECFAPRGTDRLRVEVGDWPAKKVSDADRQAFYAGVDFANPGERGTAYRTEIRRVAPFADRFPAFGRLVASRNGDVWVGPLTLADVRGTTINPVPEEATFWQAFSPTGRWLSQVKLPARFRLLEAGNDYVLGVSSTPDGVESIAVYTLDRTSVGSRPR
jgi:hypothetical protein